MEELGLASKQADAEPKSIYETPGITEFLHAMSELSLISGSALQSLNIVCYAMLPIQISAW